MAIVEDIRIFAGDTGSIVVNIEGIDTLVDLSAKLCAVRRIGAAISIELTGTIDVETRNITFDYDASTVSGLIPSKLYYKVILYNADKSYVRTVTYGTMSIKLTIKDL